jgi:phage terminase small subunit
MADNIKLTVRERLFVEAVIEGKNQTQAYIAAGYSPTGAAQNASRLMSKDNVAAALQAGLGDAKRRHVKTVDDIVDRLSLLAFTGMSAFVSVNEGGDLCVNTANVTPAQIDTLAEVTIETYIEGVGDEARTVKKVKIKPYDQMKALELLGKHLGLFKEGPNNVPPNPLADAFRELLARGSALPVRIMGPLGSGRPPIRIVNPDRTLDAAE